LRFIHSLGKRIICIDDYSKDSRGWRKFNEERNLIWTQNIIRRALPGSKVIVWGGAGHFTQTTKMPERLFPDFVADLIPTSTLEKIDPLTYGDRRARIMLMSNADRCGSMGRRLVVLDSNNSYKYVSSRFDGGLGSFFDKYKISESLKVKILNSFQENNQGVDKLKSGEAYAVEAGQLKVEEARSQNVGKKDAPSEEREVPLLVLKEYLAAYESSERTTSHLLFWSIFGLPGTSTVRNLQRVLATQEKAGANNVSLSDLQNTIVHSDISERETGTKKLVVKLDLYIKNTLNDPAGLNLDTVLTKGSGLK
jgi:hypothetical protein